MILPLLFGIVAVIVAGILISIDRNKVLTNRIINWMAKSLFYGSPQSKDVADRLYSTIKGFAFIFCLFVIVGALLYFFR